MLHELHLNNELVLESHRQFLQHFLLVLHIHLDLVLPDQFEEIMYFVTDLRAHSLELHVLVKFLNIIPGYTDAYTHEMFVSRLRTAGWTPAPRRSTTPTA